MYTFGPFRLDPGRRTLLRDREPVPLAPKAFDLLLALVENRSRALSKEELLQLVWPDTFVEEGNLKFNVSVIRKALGDESWIETLPRRGYRFSGQVQEVQEIAAEVTDRAEVTVAVEAEVTPLSRRWRIAVAALVLVGSAAAVAWRLRPEPGVRSIAILPFQSIAGADREMELGLTDSLIGRIGAEGSWIVRPTAAVRSYAGVERDPVAAGRTLAVDAVLDGTLQRSGDRIRLRLQLLRISDGRRLWTAQFDENLTDLFALEDQIAAKVSQSLRTKPLQPAAAKTHSASPEVYQLYLAGRQYFDEEKAQSRQAVRNFEMAVERDPGFAPAYAMLALSYWQLSQRGVAAPRDVREKVREAARKAVELDDSRAEGHVALAFVRMWLDYDWTGSESEFRRAIELNPSEPLAYVAWGMHGIAYGRFDETERAYRKKLELDPRSPMSIVGMGYPHFYARRYDEALSWYRKALETDPNFAQAYNDIALAYAAERMYPESVEASLKAAALSGTSPQQIADRIELFRKSGYMAYRRNLLEGMLERQRQGQNVSPVALAGAYNLFGDADHALDCLEQAVEEHTFQVLWLKTQPAWDTLRSDPRYHELLRKMHLER